MTQAERKHVYMNVCGCLSLRLYYDYDLSYDEHHHNEQRRTCR